MVRPRCKAQSLCAAWNSRVIDWLHIYAVFSQQNVANLFGFHRVTNHQRHDMRITWHYRQTGFCEHCFQHRSVSLLRIALFARRLQMLHRRKHAGYQYRRDTGRKNKARSIGTDNIDNLLVGSNISTHHAECLAKGTFDNRHAIGNAVPLSDTTAAFAVHANCMNFVAIGQRIIFVGEIANCGNRRYIAVHRINAFERNQFRGLWIV